MENQNIRAKILQDIYTRVRDKKEVLSRPSDYASLLDIEENLATFNLRYLVEKKLVAGQVIYSPSSTTVQTVVVWNITDAGIDAVEGHSRAGLAINFGIMNVNSTVNQSQQAAGSNIIQTQSVAINTVEELRRYIDERLDETQKEALKPLIYEFEKDTKADSVKTSTIRKIRETVATWGPIGATILEAVLKLSGITP